MTPTSARMLRTRLTHLGIADTPAGYVLSVHFGKAQRIDPAAHFAAALAYDADPFAVASRLEVLAGEIRSAARAGLAR